MITIWTPDLYVICSLFLDALKGESVQSDWIEKKVLTLAELLF